MRRYFEIQDLRRWIERCKGSITLEYIIPSSLKIENTDSNEVKEIKRKGYGHLIRVKTKDGFNQVVINADQHQAVMEIDHRLSSFWGLPF
ncbi:MAG: hypothetical protein HRT61_00785 [Ekhidna sp.]|nr:hypothetical protein [Ekhidna sp.]